MSRLRSVILPSVLAPACLAIVFGAIGCGGGGTSGAVGLGPRVPVSALTFPLAAPKPGSVAAVDAFPLLTGNFDLPVFVTTAPGDDGRLFVVEQRGRIRVIENPAQATSYTTFLDITDRVTTGLGEDGLLGLAFDPDYATNGRFYVNYVAPRSATQGTIVSRFERTSATSADPASEVVLLRYAQPHAIHSGGMLAFGPDGCLYVASGDGGSGGEPVTHALDLGSWLGKVLRIDVRTTTPGLAYGIPPTNPFVGAIGARPEIYAYGLRNPWRFSFDRVGGALWLGDVGQNEREEIDVVTRGGNYGWKAREGSVPHTASEQGRGPFIEPLHEYDHGTGSCIIGGYVYRGRAMPSLEGAYIYADYAAGQVWALSSDGAHVTSNVELINLPGVSSFGEDADGELLVCRHKLGRIQRLVSKAATASAPFPQTISASGIYANLETLEPSAGLVPYDVNAPLWSDGAEKDRYLALPGVERIGWRADDAWAFPLGTVLVKTFRLPRVRGVESTAIRVETRVLLLSPDGWEGYSYRWRDDQSDADLLAGSDTRAITVLDESAPGGAYEQTWRFPSRGACTSCHTAAAGFVLGLTTRQLNRDFAYGGGVDNQLRAWNRAGLFDAGVPINPAWLPAHPLTSDASAPIAARARAYLDANCAMCHRPGGPAITAIDLRSTVTVGAMNLVGVAPRFGDVGLASPLLVRPHDHGSSTLWARMHTTGADRMPSIASSIVDVEGSALVAAWIDAGP